MLGGFKWHSNGEGEGATDGRPRDPRLPRVPLCCWRDTEEPSAAPSHQPPWALHLAAEVWGGTPVPGLDLDPTPPHPSLSTLTSPQTVASSLISAQSPSLVESNTNIISSIINVFSGQNGCMRVSTNKREEKSIELIPSSTLWWIRFWNRRPFMFMWLLLRSTSENIISASVAPACLLGLP